LLVVSCWKIPAAAWKKTGTEPHLLSSAPQTRFKNCAAQNYVTNNKHRTGNTRLMESFTYLFLLLTATQGDIRGYTTLQSYLSLGQEVGPTWSVTWLLKLLTALALYSGSNCIT